MQLPTWLKAILQPKLSDVSQRPLGENPIPVGVLPIYPAAAVQTYIDAYTSNSSVYTIVSLLAKKFAYLPRYVYKVEDEAQAQKYQKTLRSHNTNLRATKLESLQRKAYTLAKIGRYKAGYKPEDVDDNGLTALLNKPNTYQGQDSYYQLLYTFKKLTGNAYVWLNRGGMNDGIEGDARYKLPVLEMWVLPSQWMSIRVDRTYTFGEIIGYTYYRDGTPVYFPKEDVLHWKDPNPVFGNLSFQQFYGMSPLQPGLKLITQDAAGRDASVAMFQNGGTKGVLSNPGLNNLSPEQKAKLDSAIDTKINNRTMKGAVVQLPGDWDYLNMAMNAVDMDLIDAQDKVFQRIANLFGVNPQLWETQTTFNNVEQARKDLMTNTILPDACSFRDEENRLLLQAFGLDQTAYQIDIDPSQTAELQDDISKMTTTVITNWTLTPNEKRQELGYDEMEDDNMDDIWIPTTLTRMEDAAVSAADLGSYSGSEPTDPGDSGGKVSDNA